MARLTATDSSSARAARLAIAVACGAVVAIIGTFAVWFVGYDVLWAAAAVLAVLPVTFVIARLAFDEISPWDHPARETPRGTRLSVAIIEGSLTACDRLARPQFMRRMGDVLTTERDDRLARTMLLRRMRDLLSAELHDHGVDATDSTAVVALLGADALAILDPHDDTPVTSAAIARCLDAVERNTTQRS